MNWRLAADRRTCKLAAAVGNHLIHIHVELRAAPRHPDVQRKHVLMLAREDLVTDLNNQLVTLVLTPLACVVCIRSGFLQSCVSRDHLARDQILPNVEVFERPLRLRSPQFGARYIHFTEAVGLFPCAHHRQVAGCTHRTHFLLLLKMDPWPTGRREPHRHRERKWERHSVSTSAVIPRYASCFSTC